MASVWKMLLTFFEIRDIFLHEWNTIYSATRGCTGFDGLTADGEAVRGRTPRKKFDFKIKR